MYAVNYSRGKKDRYKTSEYRDWIAATTKELLPIVPLKSAKYELHIHLPKNMRGDIDNRAKSAIDLLVSLGATPDDKHLIKLVMTKTADNETIIEVIGRE